MYKKTNKEILHIVQEDRNIFDTIWRRKHKYLGLMLTW